jgi:hypothetical protein
MEEGKAHPGVLKIQPFDQAAGASQSEAGQLLMRITGNSNCYYYRFQAGLVKLLPGEGGRALPAGVRDERPDRRF